MPDNAAPPVETYPSSGYMPSYAQGNVSLTDPYALQNFAGSSPFSFSDLYGPFFPQSYIAQNPYAVPFVFNDPYLGQSFDLRNLYGPFPQYPYSPFPPESFLANSGLGAGLSNGEGANSVSTSLYGQGSSDVVPLGTISGALPSRQVPVNSVARAAAQGSPMTHIPQVNPVNSAQTAFSNQSSQPLDAVQPSQSIDMSNPIQNTMQPVSQNTQPSQSQPSVQVVVQPSQPFPAVQAQNSSSSQPVATQSQMPTNVMQPVPQMSQLYGSGMMYPPQSSPFFMDDYSSYDPYLATGGRAAGATFLGILSIPFSVIAPIGLLFSLVGLHLANSYVNNGGSRAVGNFARFFNVIGLILTTAFTAAVALYVGYSAGQDGFLVFGQDPISYINNSEPMQFLFEQWNKLVELWPWK